MIIVNTVMISVVILLLLCSTGLAHDDATLGMVRANPGSSCKEIYQLNPFSRGNNGKYWIRIT